jgi:hypothetical protein
MLCLFLLCPAALADNLGDYVRYSKSTAPASVETAVVTMVAPQGQTLDLVAALHLGEPAYYKALNERFKRYDAVLYELILPEEMAGQQLPAQLDTGSGLSGFQGMMAHAMGLATQLDKIDYSAKNFVHADLTREALSKSMDARHENMMTYVSHLMTSTSAPGATANIGVSDKELAQLDLMAVLSGRGTARDQKILKKIMAATMTGSDSLLTAMGDTAIIAERNTAAMKVVDAQLARGKRNMALYYGAAHMPDLEARLQKKGWKRQGSSWLQAWTI